MESEMENKAPAPQNIQDIYLNTMRRDKVPVTIFLIGGVRLVGKIRHGFVNIRASILRSAVDRRFLRILRLL